MILILDFRINLTPEEESGGHQQLEKDRQVGERRLILNVFNHTA